MIAEYVFVGLLSDSCEKCVAETAHNGTLSCSCARVTDCHSLRPTEESVLSVHRSLAETDESTYSWCLSKDVTEVPQLLTFHSVYDIVSLLPFCDCVVRIVPSKSVVVGFERHCRATCSLKKDTCD